MTPVNLNGRWPLLLPDHRAARSQWHEGWEVKRLESMHSLLQPGMLVYDVGAEEGDMSALFAKWTGVGPVLFEPSDDVWANMRCIWEANNLPIPTGMWHGFAADVDHGDGFLSTWPECAAGGPRESPGFKSLVESGPSLPCTRIDSLVRRMDKAPDVITMDVEGAELRVLRGAEGVLHVYQPLVWVSIHPEFMKHDYGNTAEELLEFMRACGYKSKHLGTDHEEHWLFTSVDA